MIYLGAGTRKEKIRCPCDGRKKSSDETRGGTGARGADLETTHVGGEGGLVTDSGGDTAEEGRHLGAGLGEAEDVVDEEEHVLALDITEVLGDGEGDARARAGGLVHLAVDEGGLGAALELDDTGVHHLVVKVVALTRALADA